MPTNSFWMLHLSVGWRRRLGLPPERFDAVGRLRYEDFEQVQALGESLEQHLDAPPTPALLYAAGLLEEAMHLVWRQAEMQSPGVLTQMLQEAETTLGEKLQETLLSYVVLFPPADVYAGRQSARAWLDENVTGWSSRLLALEELFFLHWLNRNLALQRLQPLFDDSPLRSESAYQQLLAVIQQGMQTQAVPDADGESLWDVLEAPLRAAPNSLEEQLAYVVRRWGHILGESFLQKLLRARDFLVEGEFRPATPGAFDAPVPAYADEDLEYERFSADRHWMPRLVLIAKNTYVWLAQLSRKYGRPIQRLDQIPDEELDWLAHCGFTGLWLIGLWERSRASRKIKQMMGDSDAVASAYSLYDYVIAADLGGQAALDDLRRRAAARRIRLAADMVPNHMGIDSRWVIEHPEWFLSVDQPPFPGYTFNGPDLSDDPRVGIFLEDHYYDRTDAAVVFKRLDRETGAVRYIYHGNDGTSMPWNDTAQLDYLKPEVREQVMQTILAVARQFPIIRFDAAMTLAKKHIQRLWYPEPGQGGAIPSRAAHGMTRQEFDAAMPREFWREVVDRVAAEAPDTLLLAEAFWLMEGYFVRTLGMHRVYNSAFMHMLRDEDNAKYRQVLKNTLEFDPEIARRFVNFMNNPDEETAATQFGTTDKYFGVATLLATLPGLPMFGHGQIEGFREKYGMEFKAPKWEETVDEGLVRGHEWRIFPLLHRRYLFAEVEHFRLYDFVTPEGYVNEDVFAYSNRHGEERALVVYHNRYAETSGWVRTSVAWRDKTSGELRQVSLAEGLGLPQHGYVIFRDLVSGQEYIRSCRELWERGLFVQLHGYQAQVFLDFRFVDGMNWALVHDTLDGRGIASLQEFYDELFAPARKKQSPPPSDAAEAAPAAPEDAPAPADTPPDADLPSPDQD